MPANPDQIVAPATIAMAAISRVIATLTARTFMYVGKSSGPMSRPPNVTERSSPR